MYNNIDESANLTLSQTIKDEENKREVNYWSKVIHMFSDSFTAVVEIVCADYWIKSMIPTLQT